MSETGDTRSLHDLFAYNTWANAQVFGVCQGIDQAQLDAQAAGTFGSLTETLAHLVGVEAAYILMLRSEFDALQRIRAEAPSLTLSDWAARAERLGEEYRELLAGADTAFLDQPLNVPWFDFALTKRDGLLQVIHHSAQHRAQIFSVLGDRSVKVPDLDYVLFVRSTATSPAKALGAGNKQQ